MKECTQHQSSCIIIYLQWRPTPNDLPPPSQHICAASASTGALIKYSHTITRMRNSHEVYRYTQEACLGAYRIYSFVDARVLPSCNHLDIGHARLTAGSQVRLRLRVKLYMCKCLLVCMCMSKLRVTPCVSGIELRHSIMLHHFNPCSSNYQPHPTRSRPFRLLTPFPPANDT